MAPLKVYVASATANPETKYRVQRTLMILDGLGIPFDSIDITKPEHAEERRFMRDNASKKEANGSVLPPQFFYNDEYLGDYEDFDTSVEADTITSFLRLLPDAIGNRIRVNDANKCVAALFTKSSNNSGTNILTFLILTLKTFQSSPIIYRSLNFQESNVTTNGLDAQEKDVTEITDKTSKESDATDEEEDEEWDEDEEEDEEEEEGEEKKVDEETSQTGSKEVSKSSENVQDSEELQSDTVPKNEEVEDEELEGEDEEWDEEEEEEEEET